MIRLILFVLIGAAVLAAIVHVSIWIFLVPIAVLAAVAYGSGAMRTRCPSCGKRIKIGYSTCHHCGWSAAKTR